MNFGSAQCWIKPTRFFGGSKPQQPNINQQQNNNNPFLAQQIHQDNEQDTNIVTIEFDNLKPAEEQMQMGDPIFCKSCKVLLNHSSKVEENISAILPKKEVNNGEEEDEESKSNAENKPAKQVDQPAEEVEEGPMKWKCEFCGHTNILNIEREEIPTKDDVVYLVQSGQQKTSTQNSTDTAVVFVIDVSGSMSVTVPLKEGNSFKHSTKVSESEFEMLKQFMDAEDIAQYISMQAEQTSKFVSRKQCILAAIQQQLEDLSESDPTKKVGLITFNNDVTIYGGGSQSPITITGDKLSSTDEIWRISHECSSMMLALPVSEAKVKLIEIFDAIKEVGQTALGPALLSSIGLLAGHSVKGSSVILCTDGLANIGVGSFEDIDTSNAFYAMVGARAVENDIIFNVVSIKGEGCKLDVLGNIADQTGGNVLRVDPDNLHKDFANILQDEVVGLKAEMTIYLSNQMKFRNTDEAYDKVTQSGSKCVKYIGNVTKKTIATFEYTRKSDEEAAEQAIPELDPSIKALPFQAQITYRNLIGNQMLRVITKTQEITFEKEIAQKNSNQQVIRQHVTSHTAQLIQSNNFGQARRFNKGWEQYIGSSGFEGEAQKQFSAENRMLKNVARKKQETQIQRNSNSSLSTTSNQVSFGQPMFKSSNQMLPPASSAQSLFGQAPIQQYQYQPFQFSSNQQAFQPQQVQQQQQQQFPDVYFSSAPAMNSMQANFTFNQPQKIIAEKEVREEEEEMFSGEEDGNDEDDCEAYMYQAKNNNNYKKK